MKRSLLYSGIGLILLIIVGITTLYFWIGSGVKDNIVYAKTTYGGSAEEALIALLEDESASYNDKTHIAVWTLGQIKSEKALYILHELYQDDPKGETCYGKHDDMICQYELYKAIEAIEGRMLFSYARLNK